MPWPIASLASSGINVFSSAFERSWSRKACRVLRNRPANSAQEFEALISTIRTASILGLGGDTKQARGLTVLDASPELPLGSDNQVLVKRISMGGDLDPFAAAGDYGEDSVPGRHHPHIVLQLRHVLRGRHLFRERHGSMNLASLPSIRPSKVAPIQRSAG